MILRFSFVLRTQNAQHFLTYLLLVFSSSLHYFKIRLLVFCFLAFFFSVRFPFERGSSPVAEDGLNHVVLLPPPTEDWAWRGSPLLPGWLMRILSLKFVFVFFSVCFSTSEYMHGFVHMHLPMCAQRPAAGVWSARASICQRPCLLNGHWDPNPSHPHDYTANTDMLSHLSSKGLFKIFWMPDADWYLGGKYWLHLYRLPCHFL